MIVDRFVPLTEKDIEEKIKLNIDSGNSLKTVKALLNLELFEHEREILKTKHYLNQLNIVAFVFRYRRIMRALMPYEIQAQNLREQIAFVDKQIAAGMDKGDK